MKNILVLFEADWDRAQLQKAAAHLSQGGGEKYRFHFEGFDLFSFPSNARLLTFDIFKFVERLANKYDRIKIDGVTTTNEQFGALTAALLAQRLGLPGPQPTAILAAQHKYVARRVIQDALPEANVAFHPFPYREDNHYDVPLPYPFYVKPIKAAYSVLARRVDDLPELKRHMDFKPWERYIIKRLVRPFNDVVRSLTEFNVDAHWMLAEELIGGEQVTVDGLAERGKTHILGVVDSVMYPGTDQFLRFEYPSRLSPANEQAARDTALKVVEALGLDHGLFNVEMRVDTATGQCRVIEVNPRMAAQFSDLYEKVDGINLHDVALQLAVGITPELTPRRGKYQNAASFVFRKFDGMPLANPPTRAHLEWLQEFDPDALLAMFVKTGNGLKREMKWLGSHRYATLNMGGHSEQHLFEKYQTFKNTFGFDTP